MERRGRSLAAVASVILLVLTIIMGIAIAAVAVGGVALLFSTGVEAKLAEGLHTTEVPTKEQLLLLFAALLLMLAMLATMLYRLRRVTLTVRDGDPFNERNPRDLRIIALLLALVQIFTTLAFLAIPEPFRGDDVRFDLDLTSWFAVLIVLVLAEVFGEGARLRAEAELTV